jgi:hypothetical protein
LQDLIQIEGFWDYLQGVPLLDDSLRGRTPGISRDEQNIGLWVNFLYFPA